MSLGNAVFAIIGIFCAGFVAQARAGSISPLETSPLPVPRPAKLTEQILDAHQILNKESNKVNEKASEASEPAGARKTYHALLTREAGKNGLPPDIADAVAAIESGYDPTVVGGVGEIGLMQVRPETAAMLGFKGDVAELAKPEVNIHYGVSYLAEAWRLANGDLCRALMKYRAGHGEEQMSALSAAYCGRARAHLAAVGSPFAAGISVPMVFDPVLPRAQRAHAGKRGPRIRTAAVSAAFWAAHEARVKAISARIEAKWRRMASR